MSDVHAGLASIPIPISIPPPVKTRGRHTTPTHSSVTALLAPRAPRVSLSPLSPLPNRSDILLGRNTIVILPVLMPRPCSPKCRAGYIHEDSETSSDSTRRKKQNSNSKAIPLPGTGPTIMSGGKSTESNPEYGA